MRIDLAEVVGLLRELLGAKLVAYLGSVKETRAVSQWARGERGCSAQIERRLRHALQVALMVEQSDGAEVTAASTRRIGAARAFLASG